MPSDRHRQPGQHRPIGQSVAGTTIQSASADPSRDRDRLWLVVLGEHGFGTHPLPDQGAVTIGRGADCDLQIDEPSVSRNHSRLHVGQELAIEDLESSNGTWVRGERLQAGVVAAIARDEVVDIGSVSVLVQKRSVSLPPRRLWPHGYFEARIEDECVRAEGTHATFAVLVVRCAREIADLAVLKALAVALLPIEVAGRYGPGDYEVLITQVDGEAAWGRANEIVDQLAAQGIRAASGLACYPRDGRTADELIAKAHVTARGSAAEASEHTSRPGIIVRSEAMRHLHRLIERIARGDISVLLLGETGVGKEVMAELIHQQSPRRDGPFVRLNCAAFTDTLVESELFGHELGAFSGATAAKPGLLEVADKGTVFLDEVGELQQATQAKLLRVLENKQFLRVGGVQPRSTDVRFVAATNRDLAAEIARGAFREDLFYRLAGISLVIPPLRDRVNEIEPLARSFLAAIASRDGYAVSPHLSDAALEMLSRYSWPGNVRELRNALERAALLSDGGVIRPEHLPLEKMGATYVASGSTAPLPQEGSRPAPGTDRGDEATPVPSLPDSGWWMDDAEDRERSRVLAALRAAEGNQTKAAQLLGISRRTLLKRLDHFALPRPRKGRGPGDREP